VYRTKAVDKNMIISNIQLKNKPAEKAGHFSEQNDTIVASVRFIEKPHAPTQLI
jgi:hypothetical protein